MDDVLRHLPRDKKAREQILLDAFLGRLQLPKRHVLPREQPDFEVRWGEHRPIGVEITEFSWDATRRGSRYRRASATIERIRASLTANVYVQLEGDVEQVAGLKDEALSMLNSSIATMVCDSLHSFVIGGVRMSVQRSDHPRVWWTGLQTGEIGDLSAALLDTVKAKRATARSYSRSDGGLWLVVCALALQLDSTGPFTEVSQVPTTNSTDPFDCVFYWDAFLEHIWRIGAKSHLVADGDRNVIHVEHPPTEFEPLS